MDPDKTQKPISDPERVIHSNFSINSPPKAAVHQSYNQETGLVDDSAFPDEKRQKWIRLIVFLFCLTFLVLGRANIPDNDVPHIVDKVMDGLGDMNAYILSHPTLRDALLIVCSLFMDIMFLSTGVYWILYGKTSRIIVSTLVFYFIRAGIQQIWYVPYPEGYYWENPGFPSIVVSYGKSSDFFYSGHAGFALLNMSEWIKNKKPWAAALVALGGIYTCFILVIYRAHYSIDIFAGLLCASWVFIIVDMYKAKFDDFFIMVFMFCRDRFRRVGKPVENENRESLLGQEREEVTIQV